MTSVCQICGGRERFATLAQGKDLLRDGGERPFRVVTCPTCGFAFLEPTCAGPATLYGEHYFAALAQPYRVPGVARAVHLLQAREARRLARRVPAARRVLEVGPGTGRFLNVLSEAFPAAGIWGFDISDQARVEEQVATRVRMCYAPDLSTAGFGAGQFDLVVMRHVIEHMPAPRVVLQELRRIGSASCLLYVKVPNIASWAARVFGSHWYGYDSRHLHYFSPQHLVRLLRETGFEVLGVSCELDHIDWAGSLRRYLSDTIWPGAASGGSVAKEVLFLAVRAAFLPPAFASWLAAASSRMYVLAQRASGAEAA